MLEQPNPAPVHLPGAATAAQFCWRGVQPTSATAWTRGRDSQLREFGASFTLWRTLESMFQEPVLAFMGAKNFIYPDKQIKKPTKNPQCRKTQNPKRKTNTV